MGYRWHLILTPTDDRTYLIGGLHPSRTADPGTWSHPASLADIQRQFAAFDAPVARILAHARDAADWAMAEVPPLPRWTSRLCRVVLLGDAAHAMLLYLAPRGGGAGRGHGDRGRGRAGRVRRQDRRRGADPGGVASV